MHTGSALFDALVTAKVGWRAHRILSLFKILLKMVPFWIHIFILIIETCHVYGGGTWVNWQGKSFYYISTDVQLFADAQTFCVNQGAKLIEVDDINEHNFIRNELLVPRDYWVGMNKVGSEFRWITSGALAPAGIPWYDSVKNADQYCRYRFDSEYKLDGRSQTSSFYYICEVSFATVTATMQMTLIQTQIATVTQTIGNTAIQTLGNNVISTIDRTIIYTVDKTVYQTIDKTVTHTTSYGQSCAGINTGTGSTLNEEEVQDMIDGLHVEKKETSSYKRSLISADDPRPSAKMVGWVGFSILLIVMCSLVSLDLTRGIRFLHDCCKQYNPSSDEEILN